jgi:HlyD family secretion protein
MKKQSNGKRIAIIVGAVVLVVVIAFIALPRLFPSISAQKGTSIYQTAKIEKSDLTAYIGATGTVRSNQTSILTWQTTGTVNKVNVVKDQKVSPQDVLATLDQTSLAQTIIMAQGDLVTAQKALDDLLNTDVSRSNAELALVKAEKALDDAQKAQRNKQFQRASQETIDIARANMIMAKQALDDASTIYNMNKNRNQDDVIYAGALSQLASAQQKYDAAKYNFDYVSGLPDPLDVQEAEANVDVAKSNLLQAKQEWERVKDGPDEQDVTAAQARVDAAQSAVNMAFLTAPFAGTVTAVTSKVGDKVTMGSLAFQIDDLSHLYVDVDVSEVDIDRIQVGQPVVLNFDAISNKDYHGKVTDISGVGSSTTGTVNFKVTVEVVDKGAEIKPGMTVAANIAVNQLKNVLVVPNRAIRTQNGKRVVYLLKNGIPTPATIVLGASSNTASEVASGEVHEGDLIILNPPSQVFSNSGSGQGSLTTGSNQ